MRVENQRGVQVDTHLQVARAVCFDVAQRLRVTMSGLQGVLHGFAEVLHTAGHLEQCDRDLHAQRHKRPGLDHSSHRYGTVVLGRLAQHLVGVKRQLGLVLLHHCDRDFQHILVSVTLRGVASLVASGTCGQASLAALHPAAAVAAQSCGDRRHTSSAPACAGPSQVVSKP